MCGIAGIVGPGPEARWPRPPTASSRDAWIKALLRDAMKGVLPETVRLRRDKLGFPTPERCWLREIAPQVRGWLGTGARVRPMLRGPALDLWLTEDDESLVTRPGRWRLLSRELWRRYVETLPRPHAG